MATRGSKSDDNLWYHGPIPRTRAEELLAADEREGAFLIRESLSQKDSFSISVWKNSKPQHYLITQGPRGFALDFKDLKSSVLGLDELVKQEWAHLALQYPCHGGQLAPAKLRKRGKANALHLALSKGDRAKVLKVLSKEPTPDINEKNEQGDYVLHLACKKEYTKVLLKLLEMGVDVNVTDSQYNLPIHVGGAYNIGMVGNVDPMERHFATRDVALHMAAREGHHDVVKVLLTLGCPVSVFDFMKYITPFEMAMESKHKKVAEYLDNYESQVQPITTFTHWYHDIGAEEAAEIMAQPTKSGTFFVRNSSKMNEAGKNHFVLLICFESEWTAVQIKREHGFYQIDKGPLFRTLELLIEYYSIRADGLRHRLVHALGADGQLRDMTMPSFDSNKEQQLRSILKLKDNELQYFVPRKESPLSVPEANLYEKKRNILEPKNLSLKSVCRGYILGEGEYGSVYKGTYRDSANFSIDVAIKTLHEDSMNSGGKAAFLKEAEIMMRLNHSHIVSLVGVCQGPPTMLVQEFVQMGSLLDYLLDNPNTVQCPRDVYVWAAQIACGMSYLEQQGFVHRDLATRNILLATKRLAKVGDFGLSRAMGSESHYQASKGGRWPVKWYAPEAIEYGTFTSSSDVWSYGVTVWEMFSFGDQPYGSLPGQQVLQMLKKGERLEKPKDCPKKDYSEILLKCWEFDKSKRLKFEELHHKFQKEKQYEEAAILVDNNYALATTL